MSNPTSNFNWQMPTATDLVTDLPADFEVFGQAVDTSLADLKGGTTGQILAKNTNTDMDFVWVTNDVGDITAVTAGTGISGGGTSGAVTITNSMATEIAAKGDLIVGTGSATFDNLGVGTNGQVLTADSTVSPTGLKWATPASGASFSGVRLRLSGSQTIPNATDTVLNYTVENFDTNAYHDNTTNNSRITIPAGKAGYYLVFGTVNYTQNNTGARVHEVLYNNTTTIARDESNNNGASIQVCHSISSVYYLAEADYIEHRLYQGSGGNLDALANHTQFGAVYLGV